MNKPTHTPQTDCREASRPLEIDDDLIDRGEPHNWEVSNSKAKSVAGLLSLLDQIADESNREGPHP